MRAIINLPPDQVEALEALCRREGISRAEAIRRAVAAHVSQDRAQRPEAAFGLWRGRNRDGLAYERRLRREWDTPARRR